MRAEIGPWWHICRWDCGYRSHDSTWAPPMSQRRSSPVNPQEVPGGLDTTQKCFCLIHVSVCIYQLESRRFDQCSMIQTSRWFTVSSEHMSAQTAHHYTNSCRNSGLIHTGNSPQYFHLGILTSVPSVSANQDKHDKSLPSPPQWAHHHFNKLQGKRTCIVLLRQMTHVCKVKGLHLAFLFRFCSFITKYIF